MLLQALYYGDEQFWYDTTMLMVNATLLDYENRNAKKVVGNFSSFLSCFTLLQCVEFVQDRLFSLSKYIPDNTLLKLIYEVLYSEPFIVYICRHSLSMETNHYTFLMARTTARHEVRCIVA